jgi:hypothetical protein
LHTLGGVIGAAIAPALGRGPEPRSYLPLTSYWEETYDPAPWARSARDPEAVTRGRDALTAQEVPLAAPDEPRRAADDDRNYTLPSSTSPSAVKVFWWTVLGLVIAGLVLFTVQSGFSTRGMGEVVVVAIILLLVLPAVQLAAAVVTALVLAVVPGADKGYQFKQLGKIVLGLVAGTILGCLVMWGIYLVFSK